MFNYDSKYLISYKAPYISYDFPLFVGFQFRVEESEYPRYKRVLQAFDGNLSNAYERLQMTFQSDAERSYNEWKTLNKR